MGVEDSMKPYFAVAVLPFVLALAACSSSDDSGDSGGPVKTTPLAGDIDGHPFAAKSALVRKDRDDANVYDVTIFDREVTCDNDPGFTDYMVFLDVKDWASGLSYNLDLDHAVTLFMREGNLNLISVKGRVEVDASGQSLRVRADSGRGAIEGQVPVQICK